MLLTLSPISSYTLVMRLSEKFAFAAAVTITLILAAFASYSFAFIASASALAGSLSVLSNNPWWFQYLDPGPKDLSQPLIVIAAAVAISIASLAAAFAANAEYRRSRGPVLPYLLLFLFTLGVECLRAPGALLVGADRSQSTAVFLTRAVYMGRFLGLMSLLLASLNCIELKYRHPYVLGGGAILIAFAMAAYIPVDTTVFLSQLVWKLGDEQGVWFVNVVIALLVVGTVIGAALLKHDRRYLVLAGGFVCLLAARELLFFGVQPFRLAAGIAALTAGIIVSLRSLSGIYRAV